MLEDREDYGISTKNTIYSKFLIQNSSGQAVKLTLGHAPGKN